MVHRATWSSSWLLWDETKDPRLQRCRQEVDEHRDGYDSVDGSTFEAVLEEGEQDFDENVVEIPNPGWLRRGVPQKSLLMMRPRLLQRPNRLLEPLLILPKRVLKR